MMEHKNGWHEYSRLVLREIQYLHEENEHIDKEIHRLSNEIVRLQERTSIRATISGAIAGALPAIAALVYIFLKG